MKLLLAAFCLLSMSQLVLAEEITPACTAQRNLAKLSDYELLNASKADKVGKCNIVETIRFDYTFFAIPGLIELIHPREKYLTEYPQDRDLALQKIIFQLRSRLIDCECF